MIRKLLRFLALPNRGTLTPEQRAERNKGNCGLLGVMWLGWVVVLALVVARMVARIVQRPEAPAEPIQAQVLGGPLDGLEFELHV